MAETPKTPIEKAIELAGGSEAKLGTSIGFSQVAVNKAKRANRVSPKMAKAIHEFTKGEVSAHSLCPEMWGPEEVPPTAEKESAQ